MYSEPSSGIKLTAYSCICWLFHRIYYDARNHKPKINEGVLCKVYLSSVIYQVSNDTYEVCSIDKAVQPPSNGLITSTVETILKALHIPRQQTDLMREGGPPLYCLPFFL